MRDDDIDRAIDDVARDLTAGEPDGAFRARVMARIESGGARRGWSAWILSPVGVAAVTLIALAGAWSYRAYRSPATSAPSALRRASPELTGNTSEQRRERLALHPPETIALQRDERPTVASALVAPTARRVETAEPTKGARAFQASVRLPASSGVGSLAPQSLTVPSIALAPIDRGDSIQPIDRADSIRLQQLEPIAPIDVAPLSVGQPNLEP